MRSLAPLVLLAACGGTPTLPGLSAGATTGAGTDGTGGDTGTGTTDACDRSGDCETDGLCVADYLPAPEGGLGGARGPAVCVTPDACITALDLTRWCFDHQGCCDDLRCRTADGVCEPSGLGVTEGSSSGDGTTGSTGSTGDTTGGDTTGTTGGTTGGDGTGSSTGG